jgi:putative pyruvate formate lyase activating enzyme
MPDELKSLLRSCVLCPHRCRVNRLTGELGVCKTGADAVIASAGPHFGEEPPLVGTGGSGTIFFTGCNLGCVFCQNYEISQLHRGSSDNLVRESTVARTILSEPILSEPRADSPRYDEGRRISEDDLAEIMLGLQRSGCHNINWVTPTHQVPAIFAALAAARARGLRLPTVFNCGGYERPEILRLLEGRVDIYMPDAKFLSPETAARYTTAPDYPQAMKSALREMQRQVGDLEIRGGLAVRGLLVRHLVMPGGADESIAILDFIAREISPNSYVNVMDQYRPAGRSRDYREIARRVTTEEYLRVRRHAEKLGLRLSD